MLDKLFDEILGKVDGITTQAEGDSLLKDVKRQYDLTHVAYLCVNLPAAGPGQHYFQGTYSDSWVKFYKSEQLATIDPVVRRGLTSLVPLDWNILRLRNPDTEQLFSEAKNFRVGTQGLTFPVRGIRGEVALFSITAQASDSDWKFLRRNIMRDMQIFAAYYHNQIITMNGHDTFTLAPLNQREIDCLRLAATGRTLDSSAQCLHLSERTVRFHLENARYKLNCITTTQAVAKAVAMGFVKSL